MENSLKINGKNITINIGIGEDRKYFSGLVIENVFYESWEMEKAIVKLFPKTGVKLMEYIYEIAEKDLELECIR